MAKAEKTKAVKTTAAKPNAVKAGAVRHSSGSLEVFVSHSSGDLPIARALTELLRAALDIPANKIRCTSVDEYRLPAAANIEDQLRTEIFKSKVFIALITRASLSSTYVLFELGARWGLKRYFAPVLAAGMTPSELHAPLTSINAISCESDAQVFQLVDDLSRTLGRSAGSPATYHNCVAQMVEASKAAVRNISGATSGSLGQPSVFCARTTDYDRKEFLQDVAAFEDAFGSKSITVESRLSLSSLKKNLSKTQFNILQIVGDFNKTGGLAWASGDKITGPALAHLVASSSASLVIFPYENALVLAARLARVTNVVAAYVNNDPDEYIVWEKEFYAGLAAGQRLSVAFESAIKTSPVDVALFLKEDFFFAPNE